MHGFIAKNRQVQVFF